MKKQKRFSQSGITLVALVITIILLLILAGITIASLTGSGLFENARLASIEQKRSQAREELQIILYGIRIDNNKNLSLENIIVELSKNDEIQIENSDSFPIVVKYKGYKFEVDENLNLAFQGEVASNPNEGTISNQNGNYIIFNRNTYIETNIKQTQLIENNEFTVGARVYINRETQSKITSMDILGNHVSATGLVWQFSGNSNTLELVISGQIIGVDYTEYYEKWTDIVMTYNNGTVKIYFDGELLGQKDNMILDQSDYNFLIGTGFTNENRTMVGAIQFVKILNKELQDSEVANIDIQNQNIIEEINFNSLEEIESIGTLVGTNYELASKGENIYYEVNLNGSFFDINLPESTILENSEFTIAAKVKVNQSEQSLITSMGILGNHTATSGIVWQFLGTSNILQFGISTTGGTVDVDYTEYYNKLVDIVMIYQNNQLSVYFDGVEKGKLEGITLVDYGNIYIRNSYSNGSRVMYGDLPYVKIWNKALSESEIQILDMEQEATTIQSESILAELILNKYENLSSYGTIYGTYELTMTAK